MRPAPARRRVGPASDPVFAVTTPAANLASAPAGLAVLDWVVVGAYLGGVALVGTLVARAAARRGGEDGAEFLLARRSVPGWAAALSLFATALSAATFVGGPQQSYAGDLTYLAGTIGAFVAAIVAAIWFLPRLHATGAPTVYAVVGEAYGRPARRAVALAFLGGRLLASGARLYIVALPVSLIAFGTADDGALAGAVLVVAACATAYTLSGGLRAIIWTDVLQAGVVLVSIAAALAILRQQAPPLDEAVRMLRDADGGSKLRTLDLALDPRHPYGLWAALVGLSLFNLAAFVTDQDLAQRLLACRTAGSAARSVIGAQLVGLPATALFLTIGLLLWVVHQRDPALADPADTRQVFLRFILTDLPAGLRGLALAGLLAAAMSSLDSALGAMATATVSDLLPARDDAATVRAARRATAAWAVALTGTALGCIAWHRAEGGTLIDFALSVMVYAYSGLIGVFTAALFTRRGSGTSAIAALLVGAAATVALAPAGWSRWAPALELGAPLAFPWRMVLASALAFAACVSVRGPRPRAGSRG